MRAEGVHAALAAAAVGLSPATARRWACRARDGQLLRRTPGPRPGRAVCTEARERASALVAGVRGCIGAAPLSKATGLSRRAAAEVKAEVLTRLERERRADAVHVEVVPGVIRGFDAVLPRAGAPSLPVLVSADAGVPYRTSVLPTPRYDEAAVARAVEVDFAQHGAPLVWRADRAKAHDAPAVREVLQRHQVLVLHGPAHHAGFYGQLERQNREHRAWLSQLGGCDAAQLVVECDAMAAAFNGLVPRRTLAWRTAEDVWNHRPPVEVDRLELAADVEERRKHLEEGSARGGPPGMAERLAIVAALTNRGLLQQTRGGWC